MANSAPIKANNPKIKMPAPEKTKKRIITIESTAMVASSTPQAAAVTAKVIPKIGNSKCHPIMTTKIIAIAMIKGMDDRLGFCCCSDELFTGSF